MVVCRLPISIDVYADAVRDAVVRARVTTRDGSVLPTSVGPERVVAMLRRCREVGGKVLLAGNGGSAAIVAHVHNDLAKMVGVRALALQDIPLLTALTNDLGYEHGYEQQVKRWVEPGDLLIAVSSSGRSPNILAAVAAAREGGAEVVTYSGFTADNPLSRLGDINFYVEAASYGVVEMAHAVLLHHLTDSAALTREQACEQTRGKE